MDYNAELIKLGLNFASVVGKNSVQGIMDKIKAIKASGNKDDIIRNLEEIINDLISDKNQLIQIIRAYEEILLMQKISDKDIEYITSSIVPLLDDLLDKSEGEEAAKTREAIEKLKPILSKETFSILQLLGFNFKKAIGEPLTLLVRDAITSMDPLPQDKNLDYNIIEAKRQSEYFKILNNPEAYERMIEVNNHQ